MQPKSSLREQPTCCVNLSVREKRSSMNRLACVGIVLTVLPLSAGIDRACARTADMMWADFSAWLVTVGIIMGWLAAFAGLIDFLGDRLIREQAPAWPHVIGNAVALVLATLNMLVHTRDAWTSVVPWGLTLSALVVLILLFTGWMGWSMVYRHGVGVVAHD